MWRVVLLGSLAVPALAAPLAQPLTLPGIGAVSFVLDRVQQKPLTETLRNYAKDLGPLFQIQTGPITQVWAVADDPATPAIFSLRDTSGRPTVEDQRFGKDFPFLVRTPEDAASSRGRIKDLLRQRAGNKEVKAALSQAGPDLDSAIRQAIDDDGIGLFNRDIVGEILLGSLLSLLTGSRSAGLTVSEVGALLLALAKYRRRSTGPPSPFASKVDYAEEVRRLQLLGLSRIGESEDLLPVITSACVGGGEIFPLLLEWCLRRLALQPEIQDVLYANGELGKNAPGQALFRVISQTMRQCPYSAALGPPRKVLHDVVLDDDRVIPQGALMFVMHPGILRGNAAPPPLRLGIRTPASDLNEDFDRAIAMFGVGSRSCVAAETSLAFLGCSLVEILSRFRVALPPGDEGARERLLAYKADGTLLVPMHDVPLRFERRV